MALIASCRICDIQTLNTFVCQDCTKVIVSAFLNKKIMSHEEVRDIVNEKRMDRNKENIRKILNIPKTA